MTGYLAAPMKTILAAFGFMTLTSVYASGLIGAVTVGTVGPWLAMGARMYATGETEPREPHLAWPWVVSVIVALLPAPLAYKGRWGWATVAAVPFLLHPWWQFLRLYGLT